MLNSQCSSDKVAHLLPLLFQIRIEHWELSIGQILGLPYLVCTSFFGSIRTTRKTMSDVTSLAQCGVFGGTMITSPGPTLRTTASLTVTWDVGPERVLTIWLSDAISVELTTVPPVTNVASPFIT